MTDALKAVKSLLDSENQKIVCLQNAVAHKFSKSEFDVLISVCTSENNCFENSTVACEFIGKASAILLILSNIKELYVKNITKGALELIMQHKIPCYFSKIVDCCDEYEVALEGISDVESAFEIIKQKYILRYNNKK